MNRATLTLFWFSLTIVVSIGLYDTSYRVQDLRNQMRTLSAKIEAEQRSIHVLKAEWGYLTNPARIEMAARKHLKLEPTSTQQIARLENIDDMMPGRAVSTKTRFAEAEIDRTTVVSRATPASASVSAVKVALDRSGSLASSLNGEKDDHVNSHLVIQRVANAARERDGSAP